MSSLSFLSKDEFILNRLFSFQIEVGNLFHRACTAAGKAHFLVLIHSGWRKYYAFEQLLVKE